MNTSRRISGVLLRTAGAAVALSAVLAGPADAQGTTFNVCYVPQVGAMYLIKRASLPTACLSTAHTEISWTTSAGGTVTSITAGPGLLGGTITTSGTLSVSFAASGTATTVARSDHTHAVAGTNNTAVGALALGANTTGSDNTALGHNALGAHRTGGASNTAVGSNALGANTSGSSNTALGDDALSATNTTFGSFDNTAVGKSALGGLTEGSGNIALGLNAGLGIIGGFDNIYIGNVGPIGGIETGRIRIGSLGRQVATFIAGISGVTSSGGAGVFVNASGQLGTLTSSARFKEGIQDLGQTSRRLLRLRPVQFRYKPEYDDGSRLVQYGLIAEEVAKDFPELVLYRPSGEPETVRYHLLTPLLLNELQRQERELTELRQALAAQAAALADLRAELHRRQR